MKRTGCEFERAVPLPTRKRPAAERIRDFEPVDAGYDDASGAIEGARCFGAATCRACEICILICPDLCITRDPDTQRIAIDLDYCKGCGLCAHFCPKGAIRMEAET